MSQRKSYSMEDVGLLVFARRFILWSHHTGRPLSLNGAAVIVKVIAVVGCRYRHRKHARHVEVHICRNREDKIYQKLIRIFLLTFKTGVVGKREEHGILPHELYNITKGGKKEGRMSIKLFLCPLLT